MNALNRPRPRAGLALLACAVAWASAAHARNPEIDLRRLGDGFQMEAIVDADVALRSGGRVDAPESALDDRAVLVEPRTMPRLSGEIPPPDRLVAAAEVTPVPVVVSARESLAVRDLTMQAADPVLPLLPDDDRLRGVLPARLQLGARTSTEGVLVVSQAGHTVGLVGHAVFDLGRGLYVTDRPVLISVRPAPLPVRAFSYRGARGGPHTLAFTLTGDAALRERGSLFFDFGDGARELAFGTVRHDFGPAMNHRRTQTPFVVRLLDRHTGAVVDVQTVELTSTIAQSEQMGFVQVGVSPQSFSDPVCPLQVEYTLTNHSDEVVTFERFLQTHQHCDPAIPPDVFELTAAAMEGLPKQAVPSPGVLNATGRTQAGPGTIRLAPGESRVVAFEKACETLPQATCVVSWQWVGRTESGRKAYADVHAEVRRNPLMRQTVTDPELAQLLESMVTPAQLEAGATVSVERLRDLEAQGEVELTAAGWRAVK